MAQDTPEEAPSRSEKAEGQVKFSRIRCRNWAAVLFCSILIGRFPASSYGFPGAGEPVGSTRTTQGLVGDGSYGWIESRAIPAQQKEKAGNEARSSQKGETCESSTMATMERIHGQQAQRRIGTIRERTGRASLGNQNDPGSTGSTDRWRRRFRPGGDGSRNHVAGQREDSALQRPGTCEQGETAIPPADDRASTATPDVCDQGQQRTASARRWTTCCCRDHQSFTREGQGEERQASTHQIGGRSKGQGKRPRKEPKKGLAGLSGDVQPHGLNHWESWSDHNSLFYFCGTFASELKHLSILNGDFGILLYYDFDNLAMCLLDFVNEYEYAPLFAWMDYDGTGRQHLIMPNIYGPSCTSAFSFEENNRFIPSAILNGIIDWYDLENPVMMWDDHFLFCLKILLPWILPIWHSRVWQIFMALTLTLVVWFVARAFYRPSIRDKIGCCRWCGHRIGAPRKRRSTRIFRSLLLCGLLISAHGIDVLRDIDLHQVSQMSPMSQEKSTGDTCDAFVHPNMCPQHMENASWVRLTRLLLPHSWHDSCSSLELGLPHHGKFGWQDGIHVGTWNFNIEDLKDDSLTCPNPTIDGCARKVIVNPCGLGFCTGASDAPYGSLCDPGEVVPLERFCHDLPYTASLSGRTKHEHGSNTLCPEDLDDILEIFLGRTCFSFGYSPSGLTYVEVDRGKTFWDCGSPSSFVQHIFATLERFRPRTGVYRNGDECALKAKRYAHTELWHSADLGDESSLMSILPIPSSLDQAQQQEQEDTPDSPSSDFEMSQEPPNSESSTEFHALQFFALKKEDKGLVSLEPFDPAVYRMKAIEAYDLVQSSPEANALLLFEVRPIPSDTRFGTLPFIVQHLDDKAVDESLILIDLSLYRHTDEICEERHSDHLDIREVWKVPTILTRNSFLKWIGVLDLCFEFGTDRCLVHYGPKSWNMQDPQVHPMINGLWIGVKIPVADDGMPLILKLQYYQNGATRHNVMDVWQQELAQIRQRRNIADSAVTEDLDISSLMMMHPAQMSASLLLPRPRHTFVIYVQNGPTRILDVESPLPRNSIRATIVALTGIRHSEPDWVNFECFFVRPQPSDFHESREALILAWPSQLTQHHVLVLVRITLFWEVDSCLRSNEYSNTRVYTVPDFLGREDLLSHTMTSQLCRLTGTEQAEITVADEIWLRDPGTFRYLFDGMYIQIRCPTRLWTPPLDAQFHAAQQGGQWIQQVMASIEAMATPDTGGTEDSDSSSLMATNRPSAPLPVQLEIAVYSIGTIGQVFQVDPNIPGRYYRPTIADLLDIQPGTSLRDTFMLFRVLPRPLDHERQEHDVYIFSDPRHLWPRNSQLLIDISYEYDDQHCAMHDSVHDRFVANIGAFATRGSFLQAIHLKELCKVSGFDRCAVLKAGHHWAQDEPGPVYLLDGMYMQVTIALNFPTLSPQTQMAYARTGLSVTRLFAQLQELEADVSVSDSSFLQLRWSFAQNMPSTDQDLFKHERVYLEPTRGLRPPGNPIDLNALDTVYEKNGSFFLVDYRPLSLCDAIPLPTPCRAPLKLPALTSCEDIDPPKIPINQDCSLNLRGLTDHYIDLLVFDKTSDILLQDIAPFDDIPEQIATWYSGFEHIDWRCFDFRQVQEFCLFTDGSFDRSLSSWSFLCMANCGSHWCIVGFFFGETVSFSPQMNRHSALTGELQALLWASSWILRLILDLEWSGKISFGRDSTVAGHKADSTFTASNDFLSLQVRHMMQGLEQWLGHDAVSHTHIRAHTGVDPNEFVDYFAKKALQDSGPEFFWATRLRSFFAMPGANLQWLWWQIKALQPQDTLPTYLDGTLTWTSGSSTYVEAQRAVDVAMVPPAHRPSDQQNLLYYELQVGIYPGTTRCFWPDLAWGW